MRVRRVVSRYLRESRVDDVISVAVRPDTCRQDTLHFVLTHNKKEKADDDEEMLVFEASVEFFEDVVGLFNWQRLGRSKL